MKFKNVKIMIIKNKKCEKNENKNNEKKKKIIYLIINLGTILVGSY